jgi:hypothetical protein
MLSIPVSVPVSSPGSVAFFVVLQEIKKAANTAMDIHLMLIIVLCGSEQLT